MPISFANVISDSLVILGKIALDSGVIYSQPFASTPPLEGEVGRGLIPIKFDAVHSSIYLCVLASVNIHS
jgi:hypothetical protein